jgi:hypothetical protein
VEGKQEVQSRQDECQQVLVARQGGHKGRSGSQQGAVYATANNRGCWLFVEGELWGVEQRAGGEREGGKGGRGGNEGSGEQWYQPKRCRKRGQGGQEGASHQTECRVLTYAGTLPGHLALCSCSTSLPTRGRRSTASNVQENIQLLTACSTHMHHADHCVALRDTRCKGDWQQPQQFPQWNMQHSNLLVACIKMHCTSLLRYGMKFVASSATIQVCA